MEDSQKKTTTGIGVSFFGCLERLLSPRCHKKTSCTAIGSCFAEMKL